MVALVLDGWTVALFGPHCAQREQYISELFLCMCVCHSPLGRINTIARAIVQAIFLAFCITASAIQSVKYTTPKQFATGYEHGLYASVSRRST
jgi:hypothetical protein